MPAARGSYNQSDGAKEKIGAASKEQWKNPEVRAKRMEGLRAAWARKKAGMEVCGECGQVIPEDLGRG